MQNFGGEKSKLTWHEGDCLKALKLLQIGYSKNPGRETLWKNLGDLPGNPDLGYS